MKMEATFVIVGGGIAGVTCTETLAFLQPEQKIILISESSLIKTVTNLLALTQNMTQFDVEEKNYDSLSAKHKNIIVLHDKLTEVNVEENYIKTCKDTTIKYKLLCLCTGAKPRLIKQAENNPLIVGIRDTDSVEKFVSKLSSSRKIVIVGNGGIASELVYKVTHAEVHWIVKDKHITATFVDPGAAEFFKHSLENPDSNLESGPSKRMRYVELIRFKIFLCNLIQCIFLYFYLVLFLLLFVVFLFVFNLCIHLFNVVMRKKTVINQERLSDRIGTKI